MNLHLLARIVGLLTVGLLGCSTAHKQNVSQKTPARAQPTKDLTGVWFLTENPNQADTIPTAGSRLKFITNRRWNITQADPATGLTVYHHGGTYSLDGDYYIETVEYANSSTAYLLKQRSTFDVKVEGNTMTLIGIGNPWTEVWKRVR